MKCLERGASTSLANCVVDRGDPFGPTLLKWLVHKPKYAFSYKSEFIRHV